MLLSGKEIKKNLGDKIVIDPFRDSQLNPNSYNLRLADELLVYESDTLDMKKNNAVRRLTIPESGLLLEPNKLYLAALWSTPKPTASCLCWKAAPLWGALGCLSTLLLGLEMWASPGTGP